MPPSCIVTMRRTGRRRVGLLRQYFWVHGRTKMAAPSRPADQIPRGPAVFSQSMGPAPQGTLRQLVPDQFPSPLCGPGQGTSADRMLSALYRTSRIAAGQSQTQVGNQFHLRAAGTAAPPRCRPSGTRPYPHPCHHILIYFLGDVLGRLDGCPRQDQRIIAPGRRPAGLP